MIEKTSFRDEQALWRLAHEVGAEIELDATDMAALRIWAADRARNLWFSVFEPNTGGVRISFRAALLHAATVIKAGAVPD